MKTNVTMYDFERAFVDYGRRDNFTYEGLKALFEWLEELHDDCGTEYELDVVALCCEFTEYENLAEFQDNYGKDDYPDYESIANHTMVIELPEPSEAFIIQDF